MERDSFFSFRPSCEVKFQNALSQVRDKGQRPVGNANRIEATDRIDEKDAGSGRQDGQASRLGSSQRQGPQCALSGYFRVHSSAALPSIPSNGVGGGRKMEIKTGARTVQMPFAVGDLLELYGTCCARRRMKKVSSFRSRRMTGRVSSHQCRRGRAEGAPKTKHQLPAIRIRILQSDAVPPVSSHVLWRSSAGGLLLYRLLVLNLRLQVVFAVPVIFEFAGWVQGEVLEVGL